jgi:hypothetical protein
MRKFFPALTDSRIGYSTGLVISPIMRIFLFELVSICFALPQEKIFSACSSHLLSHACMCNSSCVRMLLPSSKCRQGRGRKSVFLQSTKEEEKEKK